MGTFMENLIFKKKPTVCVTSQSINQHVAQPIVMMNPAFAVNTAPQSVLSLYQTEPLVTPNDKPTEAGNMLLSQLHAPLTMGTNVSEVSMNCSQKLVDFASGLNLAN